MVEKYVILTEEDLLVDLTFHGFSIHLLKDFASKIVHSYFNGNLDAAIKILMEKALNEEAITSRAH